MMFTHIELDALMTWARAHAPRHGYGSPDDGERRRVRLEIAVEWIEYRYGIVARAFLAKPRCNWEGSPHINCECGPLAETRIG